MHDRTLRRTAIAIGVLAALLPGQASAEVNAIDSTRHIYPAVTRRHWVFAECAKVDPARKVKYDEALRNYDRAISALMQKMRSILVADARQSQPGISEQEVLSRYDRWFETTQNKINHDIQSGDPKQFQQQCDYIANPDGRARYHVSKSWELTLLGLPAEQFPQEVKAILNWRSEGTAMGSRPLAHP